MSERKGLSLPTQMGIGMALGIVAGAVAQMVEWDPAFFQP